MILNITLNFLLLKFNNQFKKEDYYTKLVSFCSCIYDYSPPLYCVMDEILLYALYPVYANAGHLPHGKKKYKAHLILNSHTALLLVTGLGNIVLLHKFVMMFPFRVLHN